MKQMETIGFQRKISPGDYSSALLRYTILSTKTQIKQMKATGFQKEFYPGDYSSHF